MIVLLSSGCCLQLKMLGFLMSIFAIFALIIFVSLRFLDSPSRQLFVGYLSVASLISMFASPLLIIVSSLKFQIFRPLDYGIPSHSCCCLHIPVPESGDQNEKR